MNLSPNFTWAELTDSDTATRLGIDNRPDYAATGNLYHLAEHLEGVRAALGNVPLLISSGYRSPALNAAIKGSPVSAHCKGLAADFRAPAFGSPLQICKKLETMAGRICYQQLLFEGTWVHVSFPEPGEAPSMEVFTARFSNGGVTYTKGLPA